MNGWKRRDEPSLDLLRRAATKARWHGDWFLAGPLERYARRAGLTDVELATRLDLSLAELYRLMLWRPPATRTALGAVAAKAGLDPAWLAELLDYVGAPALSSSRLSAAQSSPAVSPLEALPADSRAGSVLIVEDDPTLAGILREWLQDHDLDVTVANDGASGLARYREQPPDCLVLGLILPDLSGWTVLERIREIDELTQIVILTIPSDTELATVALERGADDCVAKPFDPDNLVTRVRKRVAARRRLRALAREKAAAIQDVVSRYAVTIPHELNQPLLALLGFAELAYDSDRAPDELRTLVSKMNMAASELAELVARFGRLSQFRPTELGGQPIVDIHTNHEHDVIAPTE
ncbi:MAG: response regulator [Chloroflexi bacterium]|nr:response regulator [Chloroflexota bacterium]